MAKSPRSGENRGRRAADRRKATDEQVQVPPDPAQAVADDRGARGGVAAADSGTRSAVTDDQIARRAYDIFVARGGTHGYHIEDWLRAERELRGR